MLRIRRITFVGCMVLTLALGNVASAKAKWISDPLQISKILHAIPAIHGDLGSRLASAGLRVTSISLDPITKDDVSDDPERWAIGDVEVRLVTEGEPQADDCQILGQPSFIKRHGKYMPEDRTGVWLLTGRCELPD